MVAVVVLPVGVQVTTVIARWLDSDEGVAWSRQHHRLMSHHGLIELVDDQEIPTESLDRAPAAAEQFRAHTDILGWHDLTWDPDRPPEGGVPIRA